MWQYFVSAKQVAKLKIFGRNFFYIIFFKKKGRSPVNDSTSSWAALLRAASPPQLRKNMVSLITIPMF